MVLNPRIVFAHARANPYTWLTALVLCISSYLCLVNLDYSLLWDDEAHIAIIAKNLIKTGTLTAWDGRNLLAYGDRYFNLNSKAESIWPPLMYVFSAVGISMFGYNEVGARSVHAFIGVLALTMFLLLLKQHFPDSPRLIFWVFLFVALSPQLLLWLRQAHYSSFAIFCFIVMCYFYEHYYRSSNLLYFLVLVLSGTFSFLNHYSCGAASILSIAIYHLSFRAVATSKKQYGMFSLAMALIVFTGSLYLNAVEALPALNDIQALYYGATENFTFSDHIQKTATAIKTVMAYDWLSLCICIWLFCIWLSKQRSERVNDLTKSLALIFLGILFLLSSTLLSPQRQNTTVISDIRYIIAALPFLLVMKGLFIDWLFSKRKIIASIALVTLLFSSAGAIPFRPINYTISSSAHGFHLSSFIKEIHNPYLPSPNNEVKKWLKKNAVRDALVHVVKQGSHNTVSLQFYIGDHVLMCCMRDKDNSRFEAQNLRSSLFFSPAVIPDYIIIYAPEANRDIQHDGKFVLLNYQQNWEINHLPILHAETQRPELNLHLFEPHPPPLHGGIIILKRKDNPANPDTWF